MIRVISFVAHSGKYFTVRTSCLDDKGNDNRTDNMFFSFSEARDHVTILRRLWLLDAFKNYVEHKLILYRSSPSDHYRVPARLDSLTRLEKAVAYIVQLNTTELCEIILRSEKLLRNVLPHSANHSYEAQDAKIGQMIKVAGDELEGRLGIFPFKSTSKEIYYT